LPVGQAKSRRECTLKLGIRSKLFLVSLGLIILSVAIANAYLTRALDRDMTERIRQELLVRLHLIERDAAMATAALDDMTSWDELADDLGSRAQARVTIIRKDGVVLGESDVDMPVLGLLDNHAHRPEIRDALARGEGSSTRFSDTVRRRMLYVAVPFHRHGSVVGFARIARSLTEVDTAIGQVRRTIFFASGLTLLVAIVVSSVAAHRISKTVLVLTDAARRMAAGDLAVRTRAEGSDEVAELGRALDHLAESLQTALEDLRAERDRMGRVLDSMREGVLLLDSENRVQLANPALREMLLLDRDIVGKTQLEIVRNAELKRILDTARDGSAPASGEIEVGDLKPRRLLVHAIGLPDDETSGVLAVFVDVTELRRLESMRRDFVGNVSHELRTPITAVRSAAETLRVALESGPQASATFVGIIERNAERLHRLVEDLLDLSRIESREFRLNLETVDLHPVADHVVTLLRPNAERKRMRLVVDIPPGTAPARAARRALEQVLSNLVDNAVKYGLEGGSVTLRAQSEASTVRVSVEDDGPGVEAKHLPRLFERFYRVDAGRSREVGGTGLGLSIVKHLVEAMGGTVGVESTPGKGSRFSVTLPRA
jgi:two-component system phosphate regulon sensor histidine kinase PhoR